ncbi:MAG: serine--tRNA ligase, partial [Tateyamaria sp.]
MHDIRAIRENPAAFDAALARRGDAAMSSSLLALDEARRAKILAAETAQAEQNKASKEVGAAKGRGDEDEFQRLRALVADKKAEIAQMQDEAKALDAELTDALARIANLPADDVPDGAEEEDNVEIHRWGTPPSFDFDAKEHFEIAGVAAHMDFETAAKTSGSRFVMLTGSVARIHRALAQFMIDTHVDTNGLTEVNSPVLVRDDAMYGTDKLPKFGEDSYRTEDGMWLVPTSEVPLTYTVAGDVVDAAALPIRMTAHTLCFRSEAGSAGRDTAGMLRQHQFEKVEMVSITHPDTSDEEQKRMLGCAQGILEALEIPYRTVVL